MLTLSILIFMVVLLASVISIGIRLAWGATKFFFGLGLLSIPAEFPAPVRCEEITIPV